MAEGLHPNVDIYNVQLQQVEAALLSEPRNESLLKLREDLVEIIQISRELLPPPSDEEIETGAHPETPDGSSPTEPADPTNAALEAEFLESLKSSQDKKQERKWKVGDKCMAIWSKNNQYFDAVIDGISEGKAAITFTGYNVTEINKLTQLKSKDDIATPEKYGWEKNSGRGNKNKSQWQMEKERRKQKALKRVQRLKQLEEDKEKEKVKWKDFNRKALAKSFKGVKKESIFATNEQHASKTGVGHSGRPMTKFVRQDRQTATAPSKMNYSSF